LHRNNKIECFGDFDVRVLCFQFCQLGFHGIPDVYFARSTAARNLEANHWLAIEQGSRALLGEGVGNVGDLVEANLAAV
jgi:hypothetical protein